MAKLTAFRFLYDYARSNQPNSAALTLGNKKQSSRTAVEQFKLTENGDKLYLDTSFQAIVKPCREGVTHGSVADSIIDGASSYPPHFGTDIHIHLASTGKRAIYLQISRATNGPVKHTIFTVIIAIAGFRVTFAHICSEYGETKQLLRAKIDFLPIIRNGLLVDELPQSFDKLVYQWVRDANGAGGLTQSEVDTINNSLPSEDGVVYIPSTAERDEDKRVIMPASTYAANSIEPEPVVMAMGHHFLVINGDRAIVDYNLNTGETRLDPARDLSERD